MYWCMSMSVPRWIARFWLFSRVFFIPSTAKLFRLWLQNPKGSAFEVALWKLPERPFQWWIVYSFSESQSHAEGDNHSLGGLAKTSRLFTRFVPASITQYKEIMHIILNVFTPKITQLKMNRSKPSSCDLDLTAPLCTLGAFKAHTRKKGRKHEK